MNSVVIVAGGSGARMQSETPKQFMEIKGRPLITWTIDKFLLFDPEIKIVIVLPENHLFIWQSLIGNAPAYKDIIVTTGGATRYHSVRQGLMHISKEEIVGIHDAVRPLVSLKTIQRCYAHAAINGSAIPVVEMEDSLRRITGKVNETIDRNLIRRVQTPQVFQAGKLMVAYEHCLGDHFTDDAAVYESYYSSIELVEGNQDNIKITYPSDLKIASALLG